METRLEKRRQELRRHQRSIGKLVETNPTLAVESRIRRASLSVPASIDSAATRIRALAAQAAGVAEEHHYGSLSLRDAVTRLDRIERRLKGLGEEPVLSKELAAKLALHDRTEAKKQAVAGKLSGKLDKIREAWGKHPATDLYNQWRTIHPASPLAEEKERVTRLLKDAEDAFELFKLGADPKRTDETLHLILKSLRKAPAKGALSAEPPVGATFGDTARYAVTQEADPASYLTHRVHVTELYDQIDDLWQRHPIRLHLRRLNEYNLQRGVLEPSRMYDELDKLEVAWDTAGQIALDFWEGHATYPQALPVLLEAKAMLSAVPLAEESSASTARPRQAPTIPSGATPGDVCRIVLNQPEVFADAPREGKGLHITDPNAPRVLAKVEGAAWDAEQSAHPDSPTTLEMNRIAWAALQAENLTETFAVDDVLEDGGSIHGLDGRLYEVTPAGYLRLLSTSADSNAIERAQNAGIEVA